MAIILDKDNDVVTYENQPEQAREMFPNIDDCQGLAARIEIIENDIAELKEEILNKTDYIYDTAQGAIAIFDDGADDAPIKNLVANIDPLQDLNGYDAPWPAGGGKNLLNPETITWTGTISYESGLWTMNPIETRQQVITLPSFASNVGNAVSISFTAWATSEAVLRFDGQPDSVYPGGTDFPDKVMNLTTSKQRFSYSGTVLEGTTGFRIFRTSAYDGAQSVTIYVEEIQIEAGSTATSFSPYSNICPITGWTGVEVMRRGKNLLKNNGTSGSNGGITWTMNSDGSITLSGTAGDDYVHIPINTLSTPQILANGTVWLVSSALASFNPNISGINFQNDIYIDGTYSSTIQNDNPTKQYSGGKISVGLSRLRIAPNTVIPNGTVYYPLITVGSTTDEWMPYQGETYSVTFPTEAGTVYGGTVDVTNGVLTVDRAMVEITSDDVGYPSANNSYTNIAYASISKPLDSKNYGNFMIYDAISDHYQIITATGTYDTASYIDKCLTSAVSAKFWIGFLYGTTLEEMKAAVSGIQICYLLATPITYQLTPQQLTTLLGQNNIWADTGDISVTYRADTKLFIQRLTQPTEDDMTANANIASGTFFMVGNNLYLSTTAIASGETIVPGTNCTALSLADALNQLNQ